MSIRQLRVIQKGGPITFVTATIPKPGPHELCIRPRAVSLNPVDYKNLRYGVAIQSWPAVLGIEGAGVVESVGADVTSFKPGDEVVSLVETKIRDGVFQDMYTAAEVSCMKKPSNLSFEEATSLPIGFLTAGALVNIGLKVPIPGLSREQPGQNPPQSILVLGGSSNVGGAAIQLLRVALPSATILTTSSTAHHAHLKSLGASVCFDRAAQGDVSALKAKTPSSAGLDAIVDAVGAGTEEPVVFKALRIDGPKLHAVVINRLDEYIPEGLQTSLVGGQDFLDKEPGAMKHLQKLVEEGLYKLPLKVEVVGEGLEAVEKNIDKVPHVSGTKLVISLQ